VTFPSILGRSSAGLSRRGYIFAAAIACSAVVLWFAWISEDAFITMTYVRNLLDGHGAVYNLGERVQGYTHPLWFMLLIPGVVILEDPLVVVTVLGVGLTFLTLAHLGLALFRHQTRPGIAALLLLLVVLVLTLTESWRSFQTAGLENSLTNFLIAVLVVELFRRGGYRILPATLTCSLLVLTRPDLAVLVGPLGFHILYKAGRERQFVPLVLGGLPVVAWTAFAYFYYGSVTPNTANAKLGVNTLQGSISEGLVYLVDWIYWEPASVLATLVLGCVAARTLKALDQRAFLAGIVLYFIYVMVVGGDYMRARFLLPIFVGLVYLGAFALSQIANGRDLRGLNPRPALLGAAMGVFLLLNLIEPRQGALFNTTGIVAERHFYEGLSVRYRLVNGELYYRQPDVAFIDELNAFKEACGPYAVHSGVIGALGYLRDPEIKVIDTVGLTDRYIASLDKSYLIDMNHRPGHPRRMIPVSYLARNHDISIFAEWKEAVVDMDCSIITRTEDYASSASLFNPIDPLSWRPSLHSLHVE
jgi:arabinofuranosyltransferase